MIVVVDTNVVVSAAFWPGSEDRRFFVLLAKRKFKIAVTSDILEEYRNILLRIGRRESPGTDPGPLLQWIERIAIFVEPSILGEQYSRDTKDDLFLACAFASNSEYLITKDKDLLVLGKPYGLKIISPREFCRGLVQ